MKAIKKLFEFFYLFAIGGLVYFFIELLWRNYSHYTMIIVGGLCFICIGLVNELFSWDTYVEIQILIGLSIVLLIEFISGCILNLWLGLDIWDYSDLPLNILGQICLPFAALWIPLVGVAIFIDDWLRHECFNEEYPRYTSFINCKKIKELKDKKESQ